jgi:sigma-B regulation protein RsbU (phosphoserine phosphatase)
MFGGLPDEEIFWLDGRLKGRGMEINESQYGFLLDNLMDSSTDSIYFKDLESRFIVVNKACAQKHGWETLDINIGKTDFDTFAKEHAEQAYADEQRIIRTGESMYGIEEKETWPDGSETWVSTTKMPLRDEEGNVIGTFGISRDITEHKLAEMRARSYADQIRGIKEEMENDVRMAGQLQKNFFPTTYPVFPDGVAPEDSCVELLHHVIVTRQVTGDYCFIDKLSDNKVGIFLCDVSGTGIRAALGTALIRGIRQEIEALRIDPGAYLARMNELLHPLLGHEGSVLDVTACYLVLDASSGVVQVASAAHPLPILFRNGDAAEWLFGDLSLRGPSLSAPPGEAYPTVECAVEPGDAVVLYTDGLFNAVNGLDDRYGKKRLLGSAHSFVDESLADIFHGLESDARAFARDARFTDDVCLVGFRLKQLIA